MWAKTHKKFIGAVIAGTGTIVSFLADGEVSQNDITGISTVVLGWATVFFLTNETEI